VYLYVTFAIRANWGMVKNRYRCMQNSPRTIPGVRLSPFPSGMIDLLV
jgi:hypothetical protein